MSTFENSLSQSTNEIKTYTIDFTNDLPSGGTVTAGTATHIPPSGSVSSVSCSATSPYLYATLGVQAVTGVHYLDILATFSNGDKSAVRVPVNVVYPAATARSGMAELITELRGMCDAGADDYSIAGFPYWSDAQLQRILDNHRTDLKWVEMEAQEEADLTYVDYVIYSGNLEQTTGGTAIFIVQDVHGAAVTSPTYTVDYLRGVVTFDSDTTGTPYWVTARSYDLQGAAAEVWRRKQSHYAAAVDFSTKVHNIRRSQLYEHAKERAEYFEARGEGGFGTVSIMRSDTDD
jgi:hypothetical protein